MKPPLLLLALLCIASCGYIDTSSFKDERDGKSYKSVKIGGQVWMAENLNYAVRGSACYNNEPANCERYGRLYNWETSQKICPLGWHLPSDEEWEALIATSRRSRGVSFNDVNAYGFASLPGGFGDSEGRFGFGGSSGNASGYWWSTAEEDAHNAWVRSAIISRKVINRGKGDKSTLCSVRCVKN
jgi:uncharacterized protein (TIGR02145 family)